MNETINLKIRDCQFIIVRYNARVSRFVRDFKIYILVVNLCTNVTLVNESVPKIYKFTEQFIKIKTGALKIRQIVFAKKKFLIQVRTLTSNLK